MSVRFHVGTNEIVVADCSTMAEDDNESLPPSGSASQKAVVSRLGLNDNKAGMEGLDKEKINKIIIQASKGDDFL